MSKAPLWLAEDVLAATGGTGVGDWEAFGVSIDSRSVSPGDLFIALKGDRFDGHDYVSAALEAGAAAAIVSETPQAGSHSARLVTVPDTMAALVDLARYARMRTGAKIVGVTGSVGKTGTKEALGLVLSDQAETFATKGNLNNHIGAPLTLTRLPEQATYAVIELGMNHAGEIAPLSRLVRPDVTIITTVEPVHLENFASIEGIADAKAEILLGQGPLGAALLNRDNSFFPRLLAHARTQGIGRIWSFGTDADADIRLLDHQEYASSSAVEAVVMGDPVTYSLPVLGRHWVMNSLAILGAVRALGADVIQAAGSFAKIAAPKGRGAQETIHLPRGGTALLIDESYNASPPAVLAALEVVGRIVPQDGGRRVFVLGDMLELGPQSAALHAGLADAVLSADIAQLYCCGPKSRALWEALPEDRRGAWTETSTDLADLLHPEIRPGDVITVKGSLGSRMSVIVDALRALKGADALQPAAGDR